VRYVPLTDYAALVTAYRRGDLVMIFFGGLTGVQARQQVPGSVTLAQRDVDERFRSAFIASTASGLPPVWLEWARIPSEGPAASRAPTSVSSPSPTTRSADAATAGNGS
jgi:hypothetical protein